VGLSVLLLFVGGALVIGGQLTLGQLVAAELVAGTALLSIGKLGKQLPKIYDLVASFEKLGTIVDLPLDERAQGAPFPVPAPLPSPVTSGARS
jgi:ABC-type bacteriocin/lantibiotic exporter with double-glycine peptidase domain